jgi:hypothetical protein
MLQKYRVENLVSVESPITVVTAIVATNRNPISIELIIVEILRAIKTETPGRAVSP